MTDDLESIAPAEAVEFYLDQREPEVSAKTLQNQRYRLRRFLEWCDEEDLDDMSALSGLDLHRFRTWRQEQVSPVTLRAELATLRVFLEFCANINAVEPGMRERVRIPKVDPEEEARDVQLEEQRALEILDYLEQFRYATREHVILAILWHTGIRLGTLRAFDVEDYDREARCLDVRHRPDHGTPLKNGRAAERSIAVGEHYGQVLDDYLEYNRIATTDDHGRRPLITSTQGRYSEGAIRSTIYKITQPCLYKDCPHGRDPKTCEWYQDNSTASGCPSSRSPHGIRRGAITHSLREEVPERVVTARMNVSGDVLDQHYDERTDREKMESRRDYVEGLDR